MDSNEPDVGQRIRDFRLKRGLSLRSLAALSTLSANAISRMERGENSPTVSSLHQLATALDVPISYFFEQPAGAPVIFHDRGSRPRTVSDGITLEGLGSGLPGQAVHPVIMRIAPGGGNADQPVTHSGHEFVYCLAGEVDYQVGQERFQLLPGCSLIFDAGVPHCFLNRGRQPAELLFAFESNQGSHLARQLHAAGPLSSAAAPAE